MKYRRILSLILALVTVLSLAVPAFAAQKQNISVSPIDVMVGGKVFLPTDPNGKNVPVFEYNGTTYAPLRALAEAYGLTVGYNKEKNLATVDGSPSGEFLGSKGTAKALTKKTTIAVSPINIEVGGKVFQPKDPNGKAVSVFVYEGTTYAPLRALAEAYGLVVGYDSTKHLATVDFVAAGYDTIIDYYEIPFALGAPQYSVDDIQEMIRANITLDEVAEKLSTLADVIQYLHQKGYGSTNGDLKVSYGNMEWHVNRSAQTVFSENQGNCGGGSNLINYLLKGDYDEQGYVQESANQGGHIYNYFKQDGVYYFLDMTQIVRGGNYDHNNYRVFVTEDPQEFSDDYIGINKSSLGNTAPQYLLIQFMYAHEGEHLPVAGNPQCITVLGVPFSNVLPSEIEETVRILYVAEDRYEPVYQSAPDRALWPANAR